MVRKASKPPPIFFSFPSLGTSPYPRPYSKRGDSNVFDEMPGLGGVITQASGINTASIWCESPDSGRLNKYCESIVGAH